MTEPRTQGEPAATRILVLEDVPEDAELLVAQLRREGIDSQFRVVDNEADFREAIALFDPDVVLSDYALPGFSGATALHIVRDWSDAVPFIFVSGTFGEDVAIESLKQGATDYLLKDRMDRLGSAVNRALADAEDRRRRLSAESRLRESEQRLRLALTATRTGLYDLNVQTGEATVNPEYARMLGYDPESFVETNEAWLDRLHPEDRPIVEEAYRAYVTGELPEYRTEFRQRTLDGSWVWILSLGSIVEYDDEGRPLRMLGTHTDITDHKLREAQTVRLAAELEKRVGERTAELLDANRRLEEATEAKNRFLANMSHELRTPLNSIIGFTGILRDGMAGPVNPEQRTQLDMVYNAGTHLLELINEVLDLAKIEAGRMRVDLSEVGLGDLVGSTADMIRPLAEAKGLTLNVAVSGDTLMYTDTHKVHQVLLNLLGNAVKFTEEGEIRLSADPGDGSVVLAVEDTGPGIAPEDIARVFDEFFQAEPEGGSKQPGTGLGLSVSRSIAEILGGTLTAESEPGRGATFTLVLPMRSKELRGI